MKPGVERIVLIAGLADWVAPALESVIVARSCCVHPLTRDDDPSKTQCTGLAPA